MLDNQKPGDIKNIEAEAGVIASVVMNPELVFYSESLRPNHFTDPQNAYIYWAVCELAKKGVDSVDAYNIKNMLSARKSTEKVAESITIQSLNELIEVARNIARTSPEDYKTIVDHVMDAAFRRDTYNKLVECERLCFNSSEGNIEKKIYETLDNVMMEFSATNEIPQYKDVVDGLWSDIEAHQKPEQCGAIPFKFGTLNQYVMIERGELVVFGGAQKSGKSMLLLNEAVALLKLGYKVLYLDSELNSKLFTCRLVSHLTGITFQRVRHGDYDASERERIGQAVNWMKTREFTHLYMPVFDEQTIYTTIKKVYHTQGIDVLIIDYFKGGDNPDAFATYQNLGGLVDLIKNEICGGLNLAGIGAAQTTSSGKLADSAKIARNASTIISILDKDKDQIQADGEECGNKKLVVNFNRNGPQMTDGEYIDMLFDGNHILYEEAKQHVVQCPY